VTYIFAAFNQIQMAAAV